jgi:UDP-N-acetylmuramoyl-tripeptide--D-alanyl-D-alanine ligase
MRDWNAEQIAGAAGASLLEDAPAGPRGVSIDSRALQAGELFVGLSGGRADGGPYGAQALASGAWGVLVAPEHAQALMDSGHPGAVLTHEDPLAGLQALAGAWRRELGSRGAKVVAITGSTGKTSTKDILAALLDGHMRTSASPQNMNTEIGLPLALLRAAADTEALVLEMAMRGPGQIAELAEIATPDVGVIVNVGPAHLELLGSLEAIAAAKAELIAGMEAGTTVIVPAGEPLLQGHLREDLNTVTFGPAGDVTLLAGGSSGVVRIAAGAAELQLEPSFHSAHQLSNLLAAVAAAQAIGVTPGGPLEVSFSAMRGQRETLAAGIVLIDDCYNANPMSMRAALDDLADTAEGRRVAVLGDMLELGPQAAELHREIARHAYQRGVALLIAVGEHASQMSDAFDGEAVQVHDAQTAAGLVPSLLGGSETVLVKGSRGVGLEVVSASLREVFPRSDAPQVSAGAPALSGPGQR